MNVLFGVILGAVGLLLLLAGVNGSGSKLLGVLTLAGGSSSSTPTPASGGAVAGSQASPPAAGGVGGFDRQRPV